MTTDELKETPNLDRLNDNLKRVEELTERLLAAFARKRNMEPGLQGPGQDFYLRTSMAMANDFLAHPSKLFEQQVEFWGQTVKHFIETQEALATGQLVPEDDPTPRDPRFKNELWQTHPYFNFLKQQYFLSAKALKESISKIEGLDPVDRTRLEYFGQQIVDLMSPTNFLGSNPDALERAVETDGESLVKGLENLVHDIEAHDGELLVRLADENAFTLGENIGTTKGKVVYRNRMLELIQYAPTTETVHKTPLIIFPPWINKFYIMDLKPQNSLIKWIVDQGYTVFMVSWVNPPDASYADVGFEGYIEDGYLDAIAQVKAITGEDQVNAIGYCIAGTTLSLTLSLLEKRGDKSIKSATFFTTLTDFSDQGEFTVFLTDDFVDAIEREVETHGFLESFIMSRTFSYLRANDLVYQPAIRSYMMGEAPPAFDLLFWNGDGTNLPARMAVEYLRWLCQENRFIEGGVDLCGEKLHISNVKVPVCAVACETDHIAAWKASFNGVSQMGSRSKTFILSQSGHIAGIINPPSKMKYGHYMNNTPLKDPDSWLETAEFREGTWWFDWEKWLKPKSGKMVEAREPGGKDHPPLCDAPGTYVKSQ